MRLFLYRLGFVAATGAALMVVAWLGGVAQPAEHAARKLQGQRWYSVSLHDADIGHYHARAGRSRSGYRFDSELVFRLGRGPETRIVETYVFKARAPFPLVAAEYDYSSGDDSTRVRIRRSAGGLAASARGRTSDLDWDYLLEDYLDVEMWLDHGPRIGAALDSRSIDFDRLSLTRESWRVIDRDLAGYRLRNGVASIIETDADNVPVRVGIENLFEMTLEDSSWSARAWRRNPPDVRTYDVAIDAPLDSSRELAALHLRIRTEAAIDATIWPMLRRDATGNLLLTSRRDDQRATEPGELATLSDATGAHPADDPAITRLARRAAAGVTDPSRQIEALVSFVHGYIDYAERDAPRTVRNILRERRGDCTEYANLLTTMARALGHPARTVLGLAYDARTESFALHNWSEVAVEGRWLAVDPTWNQVPIDAGHLRLPDKPGLAVFGLLPKIEFELLRAEYEGQPT